MVNACLINVINPSWSYFMNLTFRVELWGMLQMWNYELFLQYFSIENGI